MTKKPALPHSSPVTVRDFGRSPARESQPGEPEPRAASFEFDAIYEQQFDLVWRTLRRLGVAPAALDDALQDVFVVVYRRLDDFEENADFGRWLRGIARNLVRNERCKNARHTRLLQESIAGVLDDRDDADPPEWASVALVGPAMADCVRRLPARSRELLEQRYAANTNAPTLALAFQLSAATVRQTLLRSRAAVRRCIEGKLGEAWLQ